MKKFIIVFTITVMVGSAVIVLIRQLPDQNQAVSQSVPTIQNNTPNLIKASYANPSETVNATFDNTANTVNFTEKAVGTVTLPRALSGSGARYANRDESLVFWEHQGVLTITKNGKTVFQGRLSK